MRKPIIAGNKPFIFQKVATYTFIGAQESRANAYQYTEEQGTWALTELGQQIGMVVDGEALKAPNDRPSDVSGFMIAASVGGIRYALDTIIGWFGEAFNSVGIGSTTVFVSDDDRINIRTYINRNPREIRVVGSGTAIPEGTVVHIYLKVDI